MIPSSTPFPFELGLTSERHISSLWKDSYIHVCHLLLLIWHIFSILLRDSKTIIQCLWQSSGKLPTLLSLLQSPILLCPHSKLFNLLSWDILWFTEVYWEFLGSLSSSDSHLISTRNIRNMLFANVLIIFPSMGVISQDDSVHSTIMRTTLQREEKFHKRISKIDSRIQ